MKLTRLARAFAPTVAALAASTSGAGCLIRVGGWDSVSFEHQAEREETHALELVDALAEEPSLEGYHLLPAVRGDLLEKLGRFAEARTEFERAASLTRNARERALLLERAQASTKTLNPP